MTELRLQVLKIIQDRDKYNPVRGVDIVRILNLREDKNKFGAKLRQIINGLRREGFAICAKGSGYYYPKTGAELKAYIDSFTSRIESQTEARDCLLKTYDRLHQEWILKQQNKIPKHTLS